VDRFGPRTSQKLCAGGLAVALHIGLLVALAFTGGEHDGRDSGDTPTIKLVMIEARDADSRQGLDTPAIEPVVAPIPAVELPRLEIETESPAPAPAPDLRIADVEMLVVPPDVQTIVVDVPAPRNEAPTLTLPEAEQKSISKRLEQLAEASVADDRTHLEWEENGKQYSAVLIREHANDGMSLERVIAEVSASDRGRMWTTRVNLKRLAFSHFTQLVDWWDPTVQLHKDEIVGRFHSNTRFNLLHDRQATPKFLGMVTTAGNGFSAQRNGRARDSDIFKGGFETRVNPIELPEKLEPFAGINRDGNMRVHEIAEDTRITFFADGGYTMRGRSNKAVTNVQQASKHPVYFMGARGVQLYVKGTVAGQFLVYSPDRIEIEGNLKYARDPRNDPDSPDYIGLVSDRYVAIAPPAVTGPGDLEVQAAIFAGRRFIVTSIDHPRSATLHIYGSVSSGTLTASEPRYAMRIEYDPRFELRRPPGFPSTARHEVEQWDGVWTEVSRTAADTMP
jgi:hypothetical protein